MSPRAPSLAPRGPLGRGLVLASLALALLAVGSLRPHDPAPVAETGAGARTSDATVPVLAPPPAAIVERGVARRHAGGGGRAGVVEGAAGAGEPASAGGAAGTGTTVAAAGATPFVGLAPGAVAGRVAAGADPAFPLPRPYLVGRVGPYGVRDVSGVGPRTWRGVARIDRGAAGSEKDDLDPAATAVHGVVVGETGEGVAGAEVILYSSFYVRRAFYDHRVVEIGRTYTDAAGAFDLRPVALDTVHFGAGGDVLVTVRHPAWADLVAQPLPGIVPGQESDVGRLVLPARGVTLHGTVRDLAGQPVAGAVVRVSGVLNPIDYDKTERMVVLDDCPAAETDAEGRYAVGDFAAGDHEVSVHIRIDCVLHFRARWEGDAEWSPRVPAGNFVRGRVVDPQGRPVEAAVVAGGGNWTPTNADGTFWLDNVQAGPLLLEVAHDAWYTVFLRDVPTNGDDVTIAFVRALPRIRLTVVDGTGSPVPLVAIDWTWPPGGGPGRFAPDSRYWHDPAGVFAVTVPEGAAGATVSDASGASATLGSAQLSDGFEGRLTLAGGASGR